MKAPTMLGANRPRSALDAGRVYFYDALATLHRSTSISAVDGSMSCYAWTSSARRPTWIASYVMKEKRNR